MDVGYINPDVAKMYGIPYHKLTAKQKAILHQDSIRRAKLIKQRQDAVMKNNLKAFSDEAKMENVLVSLYKNCQKKIIADITETIAKVQKDGGTWSYANQSALTRSRGLFEQINAELKELGAKETVMLTKGLGNIYTDQFKRTIYELGKTITVNTDFAKLNPALVKKTLDYPWSGAMFSDRLWNDKATLGRNLRAGLTQSMILGESIPKITERVNHNIGTAKYNAERIARTETKRVCYVAQDDAFDDCGVEKVRYMCANGGDNRTCKVCKQYHDNIYERGKEPTLPIHPNCRCWYIPEVEDTFKDNELNELTHSVRGAENYEKWEKGVQKAVEEQANIQAVLDKQYEIEDAEFDLNYLKLKAGNNGNFSGIWKDDVTLDDYTYKKSSIQAKAEYFDLKLASSTGAEYNKFTQLKSNLEEFEKLGKEYELQQAKVKALKKELEEAQKKAGVWVDNPYSQDRKDAAYWFMNTSDADTVLRGNCSKVWQKAPKNQKYAAWDYTAGSGKFNRPLTGHAGGWYNRIGKKKVSLDYEGAGDEIRKLTNLIDKSEYDFDIWMQRGCDAVAIDDMLNLKGKSISSMSDSELQQLVGKTGRQYNFISTGVAKGKGFSGNVICNIYAPKGTKMIYAEPYSNYSGASNYEHTSSTKFWDGKTKQNNFGSESEMIIQRGAKYRITKIEKEYGQIYIDMEVVIEDGYDKFQQRGIFKGYGA